MNINTGEAVIPAGSDYVEIFVNPADDTVVEPAETVYLALQDVFDGSYVVGGNGYTTVIIGDNDYVPGASASGTVNTVEGSSTPGTWKCGAGGSLREPMCILISGGRTAQSFPFSR